MTADELLGYCLARPGAWLDQPWVTLPRKRGVPPDEADESLARAGGAIPDDEMCEAIGASYERVVATLPKKHRP